MILRESGLLGGGVASGDVVTTEGGRKERRPL